MANNTLCNALASNVGQLQTADSFPAFPGDVSPRLGHLHECDDVKFNSFTLKTIIVWSLVTQIIKKKNAPAIVWKYVGFSPNDKGAPARLIVY